VSGVGCRARTNTTDYGQWNKNGRPRSPVCSDTRYPTPVLRQSGIDGSQWAIRQQGSPKVQNGTYHIPLKYHNRQSKKRDGTGKEEAPKPAQILYPAILLIWGETDESPGRNETRGLGPSERGPCDSQRSRRRQDNNAGRQAPGRRARHFQRTGFPALLLLNA
jgi:hypothetical protein